MDTAGSASSATSQVLPSWLPADWRSLSSGGFYRLNYVYRAMRLDGVSCCITGTITGKSMVVTGSYLCCYICLLLRYFRLFN